MVRISAWFWRNVTVIQERMEPAQLTLAVIASIPQTINTSEGFMGRK